EARIGVICRGAVAQGLLVGKTADAYLQYTASEVARAAKKVAKIAEADHCTPLDIALAYVWTHPAVATAALGIRTMAQLDDAIAALNRAKPLGAEAKAHLHQSVRNYQYELHR